MAISTGFESAGIVCVASLQKGVAFFGPNIPDGIYCIVLKGPHFLTTEMFSERAPSVLPFRCLSPCLIFVAGEIAGVIIAPSFQVGVVFIGDRAPKLVQAAETHGMLATIVKNTEEVLVAELKVDPAYASIDSSGEAWRI